MENNSLALIGSPLGNSKTYQYHNHFLRSINHPAQYRKIEIKPHELKDFLEQAKQSMMGLSVTIPLKEHIIPLLDEIDEIALSIGAVNTVKFKNAKAYGYNTDAIGALQAIQYCFKQPLKGKKVIIIGAGGAAKAIAWVLLKAGMQVTITNRTIQRADDLAKSLQVNVCPFDNVKSMLEECDLLIQATAVGMVKDEVIIPPSHIPKHLAVLDVVSAPQNNWLNQLAAKGCLTISGKLFWIFQAIEQYKIWFDNQLDLSCAFDILQEAQGLAIT